MATIEYTVTGTDGQAYTLPAVGGTLVTNASPTFTTPVLGAATVTTVNKVTITQPASGSTLTIADGQTLTVNGSATLTNGTHSGTNTGDQNVFTTIAVSGQSDVVSDTASDTLTLVAGTNVTITTNATTDTITINATGGGSFAQWTDATPTVSGRLAFTEATNNGTNTISLQAPTNTTVSAVCTLPGGTSTLLSNNDIGQGSTPIQSYYAPLEDLGTVVWIPNTATEPGGMKFYEGWNNGSDYIKLEGVASLGSIYTITLPQANGTLYISSGTDVAVADGGTGVSTMTTAYAPVCAGTTATSALQVASTGLSTSGYVLTSTGASSLPTFQAVPSSTHTGLVYLISHKLISF